MRSPNVVIATFCTRKTKDFVGSDLGCMKMAAVYARTVLCTPLSRVKISMPAAPPLVGRVSTKPGSQTLTPV